MYNNLVMNTSDSLESFNIPQGFHLAAEASHPIRSVVEWVGRGWNSINHRNTADTESNYRKGKVMIGLGSFTTAALLSIASCGSGNSDPTTPKIPERKVTPSGAHCVYSTDADPTATTTYVVQGNDGRDSILFQIPGVNADQCKDSAYDLVNALNAGRNINLETPHYGDTVILPDSAQFVKG